ncbi:hypothetical protein FDK38_004197 [Candidozyma auris]|nr:hypothetical protein FDK38_004197 [[Candida] auris]
MVSDRKRQKVEEAQYTQGPLDDSFGQHRAFPLDVLPEDGDSAKVFQYLKSVREEAEADQPFYYVRREETQKIAQPTETESIFPLETVDEIIKTFEQAKNARDERLRKEDEQADEMSYAVPETAAEWRKKLFTESPDPVFLEFLEHTTIIKLVVYYTKWLSMSMPEELGQWIFTTLLRLDHELDHKEMAIVRDLGKKALKIREKLACADDASKTSQHIVNMTIAIVGVHFRQRDLLWQDAANEEKVSGS